jgi:type I restriction enzyme S subunit
VRFAVTGRRSDSRFGIVRRVDELCAVADGLERKYGEAVGRVERLTPAVLAKAFRGESVAQDPEDEPASILLERIRQQRDAVAAQEPTRRARTVRPRTVKRVTLRAKK